MSFLCCWLVGTVYGVRFWVDLCMSEGPGGLGGCSHIRTLKKY